MIRIEAAEEYDKQRLQEIVLTLKEKPALKISSQEVERQVETNLHVVSSTFRANIFGRATLEVAYRQPVSRIEGEFLALGADGVVFPFSAANTLPISVERNEQLFGPIFTITDLGRLSGVAELAKNLQLYVPELAGNLALDSRGGISLRTGGPSQVMFGGTDRLEDKVRVLSEALKEAPDLLRAYSVNLVNPDRPMRTKAN